MSKKKKGIPSDAELLLPLATLDEVECLSVASEDSTVGTVPSWCEIQLSINREPDPTTDITLTDAIHSRLNLRRHDGELIIQVLWDVLHPERHGLVSNTLWDDLDTCMEHIQKRVRKGKDPDPIWTGRAQGLAKAIAVQMHALEPDVDDVKATAYTRYCIRHGISSTG